MTYPKYILVVCIVLLCVSLTGCADTMTFTEAVNATPVGFWYGIWHGLTFPISWIGSLFDETIAVYAIYNNGGWYDFGFFLGVGSFSTGFLSRK